MLGRNDFENTDAARIAASIGKPENFGVLFDRHYDAIWSFLYRRADRDIADELASQTFVRALELREGYDVTRPNARPWLYSIARGLLLHHYRDSARHAAKDAVVASREPTHTMFADIESQLDAERARPALIEALKQARPVDVELLLMTSLEGLTYLDAAQLTELPIGTVRSRLNRIKTKLSELLQPHWEIC